MSVALSKPSSLTIDLDEDAGKSTETVVDLDRPATIGSKPEGDVIDEDTNPLDRLPDDVVRNADGSVTLPLHYSVTLRTKKDGAVKERVFAELIFHRLNGADQRAIAAVSDEHQIAVSFARSTRNNQAVMNALYDKMDLSDIARAGRVINFFVSNGPKTGG
ncbi:hypothetical protein EFR00_24905 [Rhizobium sophoriradicis]|uniref:hypothetical protein n=1 Tax=Rhizobium TaxID=379 RepID=UPI00098EA021|nr:MULTISPECIES: hypothetical protein [Rhizobium]ARQ59185.1 hypothetical protein Kim5_CH03153 [Rhizobium sp. Kim5]RSB91768.1 hypothetical protein EFR00_24905 [Rhizobium sophoriradicis]